MAENQNSISLKLGSHNSWSFAPINWYIPHFVCKCQNLNIEEQYKAGVRLFDLRLRFKFNESRWRVAHGSAFFNVDWREDLAWLNNKGDCYVRVVLEYNKKPVEYDLIKSLFKGYCEHLSSIFPNIKFFGGNRKWDWKRIYEFKNPDEPLIDKYSSTTSWFKSKSRFLKIIDDWWPWLYAKFHNKETIKQYKLYGPSDKWLFIDFVKEDDWKTEI
jgi:hypothetical protein